MRAAVRHHPRTHVSPSASTRLAVIVLVVVTVVCSASALAAHDFWIIPDAFRIATGQPLVIRTATGTKFPASESAVRADQVAEARVLGATPAADQPLGAFSISGKSLIVEHRPSANGQRVVAFALQPSSRRMAGEGLARYLRLEGAPLIAERYAKEGQLPTDSVLLRSAKYAKLLVEVGRGGPTAFGRVASHALEIVPLSDPSAARAGDSLALRVVAAGQPLPGAQVHAGRAPLEGEARGADLDLVADANGVVRVPIARAGTWNVRTAHAAPAASAPSTWDVWWATVVFSTATEGSAVSPPSSGTTAGSSAADSVSAFRAVETFREALVRGDSTGALAVLAPNVVVLESGEVERYAEYRSHHLAADIAFERAVPSTHALVTLRVEGNTAWVASTSVTQGQFNKRPVNSAGAELIVLTRTGINDPWRIQAIHWSSHRRPS